MAKPSEWNQGLLSRNTVEFDRALQQLRRDGKVLSPALLCDVAGRLKEQPGISQREFDRRFRLIVAVIVGGDSAALQEIAGHLRQTFPEALNAIRTLLPAELRHVAAPPRVDPQPSVTPPPAIDVLIPTVAEPIQDGSGSPRVSKYSAVALVGTPEEHVRNEALLRNYKLDPLRLPSLEHLWELASTGLCGFVVGGSAWAHVPALDHGRMIRLIAEHSTFLFARVCVDGISQASAHGFSEAAAYARCGALDGQRFCHGQDCELTLADISILQKIAQFLETAGTADFFPIGLSEPEASLLRLIASGRRHSDSPLTIGKLGTRELAGGCSGSRVFLLNDGSAQPFVAKVDSAERLKDEVGRYQKWIAEWDVCGTSPTFHTHLGSAALVYRLQVAPDGECAPAPTLEEKLEELRLAESVTTIEECRRTADDIYQALVRAVEQLAALNSKQSGASTGDEFWLHWAVRDLASRSIEFTLVDHDWQSISLWELIQDSMSWLKPNLYRGVVHGDIHGRNLLVRDRLPAFIDFALSGPGHPLVDLVRLDAVVRSCAMRMLIDKRSMHDLFEAIYIGGEAAESILKRHPSVDASPLARLAVRTSSKARGAALSVARAHSLGLADFYAMQCVVSAHMLATGSVGSGIERLMLCVVGSALSSGSTRIG